MLKKLQIFILLTLAFCCLSGCSTWRNDMGTEITFAEEKECEELCSRMGNMSGNISQCADDCKRDKGYNLVSE